jgi:hypothetical protein
MTAYDYLVTTLFWLPGIVLTLLVMTVLDLKFPPPKSGKNFSVQHHIIGILFLIPGVVSFFTGRTDAGYIPQLLGLLYLWTVFFAWRLKKSSLKYNAEASPILVLLLAPMSLAFAFTVGVESGYRDMKRTEPTYQLRVKGRTDVPVVMLRALDKGALAREMSSSRVNFHRWENIEFFARDVPPTLTSQSCRYFGFLCGWRDTTP